MRKQFKKGIVIVLALMMVMGMLPATAFAETNQEPNFYGDVSLDNPYCEEFESLDKLAELPLIMTITSDTDPSETASFELEFDDEWWEFSVETYDDSVEMTAIMERILANRGPVEDAWLEDEIELEEYVAALFDGYTVSLNLGEDCHWTGELFDGDITSNKDIILEFEFLVEFLIEMYNIFAEELGEEPITLTEEEMPQTYEAFMLFMVNLTGETQYSSYEEALRDPINELTEAEIQEALAEIRKSDEELAAARAAAEEYPIGLYISMVLCCDCPWMVEYSISHQYLVEKDGELIEIDWLYEEELFDDEDFYLYDEAGTTVYAKDFVREIYEGVDEKYVGKQFAYMGSYNEEALWEEDATADFSEYALDEFVLDEESEIYGLVLRYILVEEPLELKAEDSYTAGSDEDFVITGNGAYRDFQDILVDGKSVDKEFYTVEEGSTIVTLKAEYMDTLDPGEHVIQMVWTTGMANLKFVIEEKPVVPEEEDEEEIISQPDPKDEEEIVEAEPVKTEPVKEDAVKKAIAPQTGDDTPVGLYVILLLTAVCAIVVLLFLKKRKDEYFFEEPH